jgi:UPF0176 protein
VNHNRIILYYIFTPLSDPVAIKLWQQQLCESLNLKGRIIISKHGINGTLGGDMAALKKYVKNTKSYPGFKRIDFKWSEGAGSDFPRLKIKVRDELVGFGNPAEIVVDDQGIIGGGKHLKPRDVNKLVAERGDEVVFFDGRNAFEAKIGRFPNAVIPDVVTTRDFIKELESGKYDNLKDKAIITYCTGGIRCEILSTMMINRGFKEVYQIEGGIARYGTTFQDKGLWEGSLYTFDNRMVIEFSDKAKTIGICEHCQVPANRLYDCSNRGCHELILLCNSCAKESAARECKHDQSRSHNKILIG